MTNLLLSLLFLLPISSVKQKIDSGNMEYTLTNNNYIIIKNNLEKTTFTIKIEESNVIKIYKHGEYLLIYLNNGSVYAWKDECNTFAYFNNKNEFLDAIAYNQIDHLYN